jgi:GxxExxY protein
MEDQIAKIKKIAEDVYDTLGSGFPETVYDRAMEVGLRLGKMRYESQKVVELKYKEHYVGEGYPDFRQWVSLVSCQTRAGNRPFVPVRFSMW